MGEMNLPGRLSRTSLGDLLGRLHRAGVSGVLELIEGRGSASSRAHCVYLRGGLVDQVETPLRAPRLGELLGAEGILAREGQVGRAHRQAFPEGLPLGQILVEVGLATSERVRAGLRRQLRLRLEKLFTLKEAEVRFHIRRPSPTGDLRPEPLTPSEFLYGRKRARPRLSRRDPLANPERLEACRALGVSPLASSVEVRRAFRRLALQVHPDRVGLAPNHPEQSLKHFAELSAAYHRIVG